MLDDGVDVCADADELEGGVAAPGGEVLEEFSINPRERSGWG